MYNTLKLLDGYNLGTSTDGYNFVSPWVDIHSAEHFSITAVFSGASISNGTLKLQMSNDEISQIFDTNGRRYPKSATSSTTDPTDVCDVIATLTGNVSQTISATGTYAFTQQHVGYRWVRLSFTKTGSPAGATLVNAFMHFKG